MSSFASVTLRRSASSLALMRPVARAKATVAVSRACWKSSACCLYSVARRSHSACTAASVCDASSLAQRISDTSCESESRIIGHCVLPATEHLPTSVLSSGGGGSAATSMSSSPATSSASGGSCRFDGSCLRFCDSTRLLMRLPPCTT